MATVLDNKEMVFHFQPHSPIPDARELYPQQQWALVSALLRRVTILVGTRTSCAGRRFGARPLCDDVSHMQCERLQDHRGQAKRAPHVRRWYPVSSTPVQAGVLASRCGHHVFC